MDRDSIRNNFVEVYGTRVYVNEQDGSLGVIINGENRLNIVETLLVDFSPFYNGKDKRFADIKLTNVEVMGHTPAHKFTFTDI